MEVESIILAKERVGECNKHNKDALFRANLECYKQTLKADLYGK